jgi:hypothetical protein
MTEVIVVTAPPVEGKNLRGTLTHPLTEHPSFGKRY